MNIVTKVSADELAIKWDELKSSQPNIRIRNAATDLGVSEAELIATQDGRTVTRLRPEFNRILADVIELGKVMALTRNDDTVHERKGIYEGAELDGAHVGLFVGHDIDLRIFFATWKYAFAVKEGNDKPRYSIQFFANDGEAIHKIYMLAESNMNAFESLVDRYKESEQSADIEVVPVKKKKKEERIENFDPTKFREEWLAMKDTHEFFGLTKRYKLGRIQALQSAPEAYYAHTVKGDAVEKLLQEISVRVMEIMVFVGNKGMIQIHTGPAKKIVPIEGWLNVLDSDFNLHIKTAAIHQVWVVRKPTEDGIVTSVEVFNEWDELIVQFFGKRKPGIPERTDWQQLVADIEKAF